jgi:hypothetical protein
MTRAFEVIKKAGTSALLGPPDVADLLQLA